MLKIREPYIVLIVFNFCLFWFFTGFSAGGFLILTVIYGGCILLALSPHTEFAEELWRALSGVRPLRLKSEKERLMPLFKEVASKTNINFTKNDISLYISESLDINAFAFGRKTLILTRGALKLDDDSLKGLMLHELGHFYHGDTSMALVGAVGNLPMSMIVKGIDRINQYLEVASKKSILMGLLKFVLNIFFAVFKLIDFVGSLILMSSSREEEYRADQFTLECGYGKHMAKVLTEIYEMSAIEPESIKEQLKATHPPLTSRIEKLENILY